MKNEEFYFTVARRCKEKGITLSQLADKIGISYRSLLNHLHDSDSCSVRLVKQVSRILWIDKETYRKDLGI